MQDTIFVPSFGNRPRNLVGRDDVLALFNDSFSSIPGSRDRSMLLLGPRGSGKTVLLLELAEMAEKKSIITASPTIVSKDMNDRILEKLAIASDGILGKSKKKLSGGSLNVLGFGAGIQLHDGSDIKTSFAQSLSELCERINAKGHPMLILVDETQPNNEDLKKLIVAYQEMVGKGLDIFLVLAGLPETVSSVLNDHVLTFLNRAVKVELAPLRTNDVETYYADTFKSLDISMSKEAAHAVAIETAGSPYLMQLIGHYIITKVNKNTTITQEILDQAISQAKDDYKNDICKTTIASLSDRDIDFLLAMSEDDGESDISQVIKRLGCTSAFAQTYKRRLLQSGTITQPRRGKLAMTVPYLREYVREQFGS